MNNIYLIGMRGVGKTTVGKLLAARFQREFFDMDEWIRSQEAIAIANLVKERGWDYFRKKEQEAVAELSQKNAAVISTGGGVLMYFDNAEKLKKTGELILLTASIQRLEKRLQQQDERPSITGTDPMDELEALWKSRKAVYEKNADLIIDTEGKSAEKIVDEIVKFFLRKGLVNNKK